MNVNEAAKSLLVLREHEVADADWEAARQRLVAAISSCRDAADLRTALTADLDDLLPVDLKTEMYRKLLAIAGRSPELLRQYAWHLQLHGPERDEEAAALLREAEKPGV